MNEQRSFAAFRMSGAGNDFIALVEPDHDPDPGTVRAWCLRGTGLGADGVFVLTREESSAADPPRVRMVHYNADGSVAELCANGTRCAARLAVELGWAEDEVVIVTGTGPLPARVLPASDPRWPPRVTIQAPLPEAPPEKRTLTVAAKPYEGYRVKVGVPWFVLPWNESLEQAPLATLGPPLRHHPELQPEGANVGFIQLPASAGAPSGASGEDGVDLHLRAWERGVEAETLASGTGSLAAARVARGLGLVTGTAPVRVHTAGGVLEVAGDPDGPEGWTLTGDARLLARLEILPEAGQPSP